MNLKNIIISIGVFVCISLIAYAGNNVKYSKMFSLRLFLCLPYRESFVLDNDIQISRRIYNWSEHKCKMHEEINYGGKSVSYDCLIGRSELNNVYNAMNSDPYGKILSDKIWLKYKSDKNICTPSN